MGIYDSQAIVPKRDTTGMNFWKWDAAILLYGQIHDATDVLLGVQKQPHEPLYAGLLKPQEPLDVTSMDYTRPEDVATIAARKAFDNNVKANNDLIKKAAERQKSKVKFWCKLDALLKMTFLGSIPREVYGTIATLSTAAQHYSEIAEFLKLRCSDCSTTTKFTDKFRASLSKLRDLKLNLPKKGKSISIHPRH
ncbi:hypothetical protein EJ02DRAFT_445937 [Clathrospora elynae]|uniref:Uncharacterized protein n=1 Tax=Clathrospora elynae TaxID=706981 RepID=A0A6A5SJL4_9PLEO|nr:hypothetical protein EJ02DRAFT_445937 [Clathrospora elynae]